MLHIACKFMLDIDLCCFLIACISVGTARITHC